MSALPSQQKLLFQLSMLMIIWAIGTLCMHSTAPLFAPRDFSPQLIKYLRQDNCYCRNIYRLVKFELISELILWKCNIFVMGTAHNRTTGHGFQQKIRRCKRDCNEMGLPITLRCSLLWKTLCMRALHVSTFKCKVLFFIVNYVKAWRTKDV